MVKNNDILIVEDDIALITALNNKFSESGFTVYKAYDGEEGLNIAYEKHPDILLLDILIPKLDGITLLSKLREDEWGKGAKVIMLTVIENTEAIARAVEDNSLAYLIKTNESMDDVVEKVKMMLRNN